MSIVTIATSKGGAGKTTLAQLLTGTLSAHGLRVAAIDADFNHSLADWVRNFEHTQINIATEVDETKIIPLAERLSNESDVLVIDTAGAATQATVFAIGCADLVLIPCQMSSADVVEAVKTKQLVESAATLTRQTIQAKVVLTDYQPNTVIAGHVESELAACGLEILETKLHRLVAYKEMTFTGQVPETGKAAEQVREVITEITRLAPIENFTMKIAS